MVQPAKWLTHEHDRTAVGGRFGTPLALLLPEIELGVVRLVELVELLAPLLAGFLGSEAPLLPVIVPVVGVEFLSALPVFGGERRVPAVVEPDGQLEAGVGLHFGGGAGLYAASELVVGERILAALTVADPLAQGC